MKKFKNYSVKSALKGKNKIKGFTLVELIIVIAIIGVLAAILIPTMSGKVKAAKLAAANDAAAKLAEQASIIATEMETNGVTVNFSNKAYSCGNLNAPKFDSFPNDDKDPLTAFKNDLLSAVPKLNDVDAWWGIVFDENGSVIAALYGEKGSKYLGTYPYARKEPLPDGKTVGMNNSHFFIPSAINGSAINGQS